MHKLLAAIAATTLLSAPIQAAAWQGADEARAGAFVGARLQLPLGGAMSAQPRAGFALAPTQSRISTDGMVRTRIGEGLAFNLAPNTRPSVTLAGIRADTALGLQARKRSTPDHKSGVSTGGWIAIGVGTALVVAGVGLALLIDAAEDNSE